MKHTYHLFFLSFFLINHIHAEVPFTWILYMYSIINPAYHHLLPMHGILCRVEHMYRNGNKLVKELFYLQEDNVSFRPTILKSKPASYWTPQDIGMIIRTITAYRAKKLDDYLLHIQLEQIIQPQQEKMCLLEKEMTARINTHKESLQDIAQQSKKLFTLIGQTERKPCTTVEQLDKKITEIEQLKADQYFFTATREPIEDTIKKLKYNRKLIKHALQSGISELIMHVCDSIKESSPKNENRLYDAYTTEHILLALLWKIANPHDGEIPKQDFIDYFNQLGSIINADNLDAWSIAKPYSLEDYEEYKSAQITPNEQYTTQQLEQTLLAQIGKSVWESSLPPIITGAGAVYTDQYGNQSEQGPACVETSFRMFLNMIAYNAKKKKFDIEHLYTAPQQNKRFPLQPSTQLINFYQKHNCVTNLQASEICNAWAHVLTNLAGIIYMKPHEYAQRSRFYEVKSCLPNMLKVCNHLLFDNNQYIKQLSSEKQLDILCDAISRDNFIVSWDVVDEKIKKDTLAQNEYVTLKFFINDAHSFEWQLKKGHSVIPRINTINTI